MKFRLLRDILIYLVVPIMLFNANIINNQQTVLQIACSLAIIYSIFTKIKENRINTTGVFIFLVIIVYFLTSLNPSSDNRYFYNTCIILFIALLIPMLKMLNKNVAIVVIRDILKSLNKNSLAIIRLLKKKTLINEINKISYAVEVNLILIALLRMINILIYGNGSNSYINVISNCIGMGFVGVIVYKTIKVIYAYKKLNIKNSNKNFKPEDNTKGKVINFNYFK